MGAEAGRAFFIVLDSVGIGELPDAAAFGDVGSHTLGHIMEAVPGTRLPNMQALGLGNIEGFPQLDGVPAPAAAFGKMAEVSQGKDTATGHWEFVGLVLDEPFQTFPDGFPDDILEPFLQQIGKTRALGNQAISGTVIIEQLGEEHVRSGDPIVYTSADPVFQIAAHEDVVPIEELYRWCKIAYDLVIPRGLSRVIARPFTGEAGSYTRTSNRKDFALPPPRRTALDALIDAGVHTVGVGKIHDVYAGCGINASRKTRDNAHGMTETLDLAHTAAPGTLVFTNLVDFDAKYGHRRNPTGYAQALEAFDAWLPAFLQALRPDDLVIITADHGNDPTYRGTDHTREYVPLLTWRQGHTPAHDLGTRASFADIGATLADYFGAEWGVGESFLASL